MDADMQDWVSCGPWSQRGSDHLLSSLLFTTCWTPAQACGVAICVAQGTLTEIWDANSRTHLTLNNLCLRLSHEREYEYSEKIEARGSSPIFAVY